MMVEKCSTCAGTCWLPCQSCACCSWHDLSLCLEDLLCDSLSHCSFTLGELLLWLDDDFLLLVESGGAQGEEVLGDLLLVLGDPPPSWRSPVHLPKSGRMAVLTSWDCWDEVSPLRNWRPGTPSF